MSCFLGIDAGTSGIKAIIIDETGQVCGSGFHECDISTPHPGWVEQNPADWWEACKKAVRQAVTASGRGSEVKSIGFSGQMQGCTLVDKRMQPIRDSLIWLDQRAVDEVADIEQLMTPKEMLASTANFCLNSHWAPKLLWVKKHEPKVFNRIHKVLFTKDYLRYRMTGVTATEVSDASLSFLLNVAERKWADNVFARLSLPMDIVPELLVESKDITGYLKSDVAQDLGLPARIPVVAGGGDQPVSGVGTGIIQEGVIGTAIGTSGVVFGCTDQPLIDTQKRALYTMAHAIPDKWCFLGLVLTAGGAFKWLRNTFFAAERDAMAAQGKDVYDHMTALAAQSSPGSEGLIFLPYLNGEKTPISDSNARGVFFGLSVRHDKAAICRSVMEGVTFALRDTIEICREFGTSVTQVRATGGGAKSRLWRQMQADIYNAEIITMNMEEGPAAGAAILASVGAGYFETVEQACGALLKVSSVTKPISENVKRYEDDYQTYHALYQANRSLFEKQARIVRKYL